MSAERLRQTPMPRWVKMTIGIGLLFAVAVAALAVTGHGPWQHSAAASMHG